jgi:alkanesulfonate monooxygenase SsuD/methylene tetrahydromethanopterin reductase-like flavin-dependent oxidoreductase (luciferase family)
MRVGVQLPEVEYQATWQQLRDMAHVAEEAGLDSLWVGDHLLYDEGGRRSGPWEAWSLLAGLAAVTERIDIGPLVAALPFHRPAVLAKAAATIDEISGGRLIFGVGAGWNEVEFRAFGIPYQQRVSRFAEAFEIIRRLLSGERFDFSGSFYALKDVELIPKPSRAGGIPFMLGSNGDRMLSIGLPYSAWWNSWYSDFDNDPAKLEPLTRKIDEAAALAERKSSTLLKSVAVYVGFGAGTERRTGGTPWRGSSDDHMARLQQVRSAGIDEVIGVLDPITAVTIEKWGEIAAAFRAER